MVIQQSTAFSTLGCHSFSPSAIQPVQRIRLKSTGTQTSTKRKKKRRQVTSTPNISHIPSLSNMITVDNKCKVNVKVLSEERSKMEELCKSRVVCCNPLTTMFNKIKQKPPRSESVNTEQPSEIYCWRGAVTQSCVTRNVIKDFPTVHV